jgi:GABA permease
VPGHPDERYLDIRRRAELKDFVAGQLDDCWTKGFDGVDAAALDTAFSPVPDGVGFPLTSADQQALVRMVAGLAHARGLAVGLHSGPIDGDGDAERGRFVAAVEPLTDFAVVERCIAAGPGCGAFSPYPQHGKAVFHVEYLGDYPGATTAAPQSVLARVCPAAQQLGFSSILKDGGGNAPGLRGPLHLNLTQQLATQNRTNQFADAEVDDSLDRSPDRHIAPGGAMRRILIVANQTLGGAELISLIRNRSAAEPSEFWVLVPATEPSDLTAAGQAAAASSSIASAEPNGAELAEKRLAQELDRLRSAGATADGEIGDPDPLTAIAQTLNHREFDEILLATLPVGLSRWLRQDLPHKVQRKFGLPVTHVETASPA